MPETISRADVVAWIMRSAERADLDAIYAAAKQRAKSLRDTAATINVATLSVGDVVTLSGLRPKYLNGTEVVVTKIIGNKIIVQFDAEHPVPHVGWQRFAAGRDFGVPSSCVEKIEA